MHFRRAMRAAPSLHFTARGTDLPRHSRLCSAARGVRGNARHMPAHSVNWSDPTAQWLEFVSGYQQDGTPRRFGRPAGIAVGPQGDLFVADDAAGAIYRIRPRR